MNRGYVKLWRKIDDSGLLQSPVVLQLFCYILLKASHKKAKMLVNGNIVELEPGQLIFGRKRAAEDLNQSEQSIRTALETLKKLKIVTSRPTNRYSLITVENWALYQGDDQQSNQQDNQPANQQSTSNQPAANHKQECKEFKNKETPLTPLTENEASCPAPRPPVGVGGESKNTSDDFLDEPEIEFQELRQFYNENARQEGPLAGHAEYKALVYRKLFNFASVMQGIMRLKEHDSEWIRGYAPGLAKFLRERGWEKEAVTMKKPSSSRAHIIAAARGEKYAENRNH